MPSPWGITEQCIERVALERRDSNFIAGAGAFLSGSHDLCSHHVLQPQWNLKGSLGETSEYDLFVTSWLH